MSRKKHPSVFFSCYLFLKMGTERVELSRVLPHLVLSQARLPVPPRPHGYNNILPKISTQKNTILQFPLFHSLVMKWFGQ